MAGSSTFRDQTCVQHSSTVPASPWPALNVSAQDQTGCNAIGSARPTGNVGNADTSVARLWVLSDLHIELTRQWDLPAAHQRPGFDVAIVAGDLTPRMEKGVAWLAARFEDRPVIYISGNHEGYRADIDRTIEKARVAARGTNVIVLERESVVLSGIRFLAGTLWTDFGLFGNEEVAMRTAREIMNDYRLIRVDHYARRLHPRDTLARHRATRAFIERELAQPFAGPSVVITHHAPYRGGLKPQDQGEVVSSAYASDLSELITKHQPDVWIYGHTHRSDDTRIGRTRIVSNAKGYGPWPGRCRTWDNPRFDPLRIVEVALPEPRT